MLLRQNTQRSHQSWPSPKSNPSAVFVAVPTKAAQKPCLRTSRRRNEPSSRRTTLEQVPRGSLALALDLDLGVAGAAVRWFTTLER